MSSYNSPGSKTAGTIRAQPHDCPHCGEDYTGNRTPRGRPYCGECGRILRGERPESPERSDALTYSALGVGR